MKRMSNERRTINNEQGTMNNEKCKSEVCKRRVSATSNAYEQRHCSLIIVNCTLISALIIVLASCSPLGFLGEGTVYDTIWAEPKRLFYNLGESFVPGKELSVYASYRNFTEEIPLSRVTLSIVTRPGVSRSGDNGVGDEYDINGDDFVLNPTLIGKGRKQIIVTMDNYVTSYYIMIDDPFGLAPDDDDEEDPDGGGIGIVWKEP